MQSFRSVKSDSGLVVDRITAMNTLCEKLGIPITLMQYQIFDAALAKDYPEIKAVTSLLQSSDDEGRFRKLDVGAKFEDSKRQAVLLMEAASGTDEDELLDMAFRLNEVGKRSFIKKFLKIMPRAGVADSISEALASAKTEVPKTGIN
jgi:hypothetical protein